VWWAAETFDVYVGVVTCWVAGHAEQSQPVECRDLAAALTLVQEKSQAARRSRRLHRPPALRIWLSGGLARPFLVGPVAGLRRWHEAMALASAAAPEATGLTGSCRTVLEGWPGDRAALAIAVPTPLLERIDQEARRLRQSVQSIRPWWCRMVESASAPAAAGETLAIEDSDALTILREQAGQFVLARTYSPRPSADQVASVVVRTALAEGVEESEVRVLNGYPADALGRAAAPPSERA
jgi:hypothetical protein